MDLPKARTVLGFVAIIGYILITIGFFIVLFFSSGINLPEGDLGKQLMGMFGLVVGTWNAAMLMVFAFNYGTSQGSVDKNDLVRDSIRQG